MLALMLLILAHPCDPLILLTSRWTSLPLPFSRYLTSCENSIFIGNRLILDRIIYMLLLKILPQSLKTQSLKSQRRKLEDSTSRYSRLCKILSVDFLALLRYMLESIGSEIAICYILRRILLASTGAESRILAQILAKSR